MCSECDVVLSKGYYRPELNCTKRRVFKTELKTIKVFQIMTQCVLVSGITVELSTYTFKAAKLFPPEIGYYIIFSTASYPRRFYVQS
jgi:hypothetical protein